MGPAWQEHVHRVLCGSGEDNSSMSRRIARCQRRQSAATRPRRLPARQTYDRAPAQVVSVGYIVLCLCGSRYSAGTPSVRQLAIRIVAIAYFAE